MVSHVEKNGLSVIGKKEVEKIVDVVTNHLIKVIIVVLLVIVEDCID